MLFRRKQAFLRQWQTNGVLRQPDLLTLFTRRVAEARELSDL
jgi:hypothetical protein